MAEEKIYKVVVARPAKIRYQKKVLPYLLEYFSLKRALEIDENILRTASSLSNNSSRGGKEKYLIKSSKDFRFILHKETKHFEIKVIYFIDYSQEIVYITDFFPTKMNPIKISKNRGE